ncbi:malto-oligosyltrehalose trehalohydrolase [Acidovorax sp. LjRoot117]|uniref:malto-oligosyltrehalose trehalohydrolase n=1 Tax=Acidovorax sp. LjRoot117 TaxID=3342255 RepID=UPI003ECD218E
MNSPAEPPDVSHPMPFGARLRRRRAGADFRLWAPAASQVALVHAPDGNQGALDHTAAERLSGGWWHVGLAQATASTRYQWLINGDTRVPDPAARQAPDGPHGLCVVSDPSAYAWEQTAWSGRPWHELVFYELHIGTFTPQGTYTAAAAHLPRLAAMGFTALELMPLATFGGQWGWGYDGVLPFAPHPAYGTPDDLKRFVDTAHALGLCVFLDVVYNHFGPDGNYLHTYAPAFFSDRHDSPWGRAINFDLEGSEVVRAFFLHNALYWIDEFRMDGLRLDAVHAIADDSNPDILQEISTRVHALAQATDRHVHLVLENEKNQPARLAQPASASGHYDGQWNDDFHHAVHVALTGETHTYYAKFAADPIDLLARVLTQGFAFPNGRPATDADAPLPLSLLVNFIGNHDQIGNRAFGERLSMLVPGPAVELALLLSLLTPATPMVFMGDEWGATTPFLYFANWEGALRDAVRSGRQREFSHVLSGAAALPDPCDAATLAASQLDWSQAETPAARQRSELVRQALEVRRHWLLPHARALRNLDHTAERVGAHGLRVGWRYGQGMQWWLEINLGPERLHDAPPAPEGVAVFQHRWIEGQQGAPRAWEPWSARWTCTEGFA